MNVAAEVPTELVDALAAGDCVLFAGAGLGARAGLPTWSQFLKSWLSFASSQQVIETDMAQSLDAALLQGDRDSVADALAQAFSDKEDLLNGFVMRSFARANQPLHATETMLAKIPFSSVVTTDYGSSTEQIFPEYATAGLYTASDTEPLLDALAQKRKFILKLWGSADRPDSLILAPIEYRQAVSSNVSFSNFVEGLFFSRSFLFLGMSLEGIQDFLSGFVFRGANTRRHFALVSVSGIAWKAKAMQLEKRHNIKIIDYRGQGSHPELDTFVANLTNAVAVKKPSTAAAVPPGIRKLVLEDIGCFEKLELDFSKNWKILLGDNGVGKSTILKAIAVAIIGSDANSFAGRLVRAGKPKGRITLYTAKNPHGYVTDIHTKDLASEADVKSIPSRCMEAEGWLALAFSPLRVMSWSPSSGPQLIVQKGRPTSDDLLPLLSGETDTRMDRLKQWVVNLDAADKPAQIRSLTGHSQDISSLAFAPDARTLISASIDRSIRAWDANTGKPLWVATNAHGGGINAMAMSRGGNILVTGSFDKTCASWNGATGAPIRKFVGSNSQILSIALSVDGARMVSGSEGGTLRVWDVDSGKEKFFLPCGGGSIWSVALSQHGDIAVAGLNDGNIKIFDTEQGALLRTIETDDGGIWALALGTDGKTLITGSENGSVKVWDMVRRIALRTLQRGGRAPGIHSVAISGNGQWAGAGAENGRLRVWDLTSGEQLLTVQAHSSPVHATAFNWDLRSIASASNSISLWKMPEPHAASMEQESIKKFFELVGTLTDRADIRFLRVTDDYRVMVSVAEIPDGVPVEVLSQGTTSLLGWVGVLCQRLRETQVVSSVNPLPTDAYALVLIDELDAHMHPKWQQVLVTRLKNAFPNVQFVACTHSPLIVGGLEKAEVERFVVEKGKVVKVDFDADMTMGRTDQVLLGELFELETTLDPTTQDNLREYEDLLGKSQRSAEEETRFQELRKVLRTRIPPSPSNPVKRRAQELLDYLHDAKVDLPDDFKEHVAKLSKAMGGEPA